jgi:hypothetical protein
MRTLFITFLLFVSLLGTGALELKSNSEVPPESELDPCTDPPVNCVRIWKPGG